MRLRDLEERQEQEAGSSPPSLPTVPPSARLRSAKRETAVLAFSRVFRGVDDALEC